MATNINRYYLKDGQQISLSPVIYNAVKNKKIPYKKVVTKSGDRLDHFAYQQYEDANLWWVIASASGIGWWLQVSEGTVLFIPERIEDIINLKEKS